MNPIDRAFSLVMLACSIALLIMVWIEHAEGAEAFIIYPDKYNEVTGWEYTRSYLPPSEHPCRTPSVYVSERERYWVFKDSDFDTIPCQL